MDTEMTKAYPYRLPRIVFSGWVQWAKRSKVQNCRCPGVYLLARFNDSLPCGKADPLSPHIVLIGETRRLLRKRWDEFHDAVCGGGRRRHSGGDRYREKQYPQALEGLYVAAMPSSPLQWRGGWPSTRDEELAQGLKQQKDEVYSAEDVRKFKEWFESSAPAKTKGTLNGAWIKFVERKLILDFVVKWGSLPELNAE